MDVDSEALQTFKDVYKWHVSFSGERFHNLHTKPGSHIAQAGLELCSESDAELLIFPSLPPKERITGVVTKHSEFCTQQILKWGLEEQEAAASWPAPITLRCAHLGHLFRKPVVFS